MQDGLFELRVRFAADIVRVFYFFFAGNKIIVTNGFVKKTQKTPLNELNKALKYKRDYEGRLE
jgi:phage-related protein